MEAQTLREAMGGNLPDGGYTCLIDGYNNAYSPDAYPQGWKKL